MRAAWSTAGKLIVDTIASYKEDEEVAAYDAKQKRTAEARERATTFDKAPKSVQAVFGLSTTLLVLSSYYVGYASEDLFQPFDLKTRLCTLGTAPYDAVPFLGMSARGVVAIACLLVGIVGLFVFQRWQGQATARELAGGIVGDSSSEAGGRETSEMAGAQIHPS